MIGFVGLGSQFTIMLIASVLLPVIFFAALILFTRRFLKKQGASGAKFIVVVLLEVIVCLSVAVYLFGPVYKLYLGF